MIAIWLIGWMFALGLKISDIKWEQDDNWIDKLFIMHCIMFFYFFTWPYFLGKFYYWSIKHA